MFPAFHPNSLITGVTDLRPTRRERMRKRLKCDQNQTPLALRRIRSDVEQSRTGV
jgi:hypothetical protein